MLQDIQELLATWKPYFDAAIVPSALTKEMEESQAAKQVHRHYTLGMKITWLLISLYILGMFFTCKRRELHMLTYNYAY